MKKMMKMNVKRVAFCVTLMMSGILLSACGSGQSEKTPTIHKKHEIVSSMEAESSTKPLISIKTEEEVGPTVPETTIDP